MSNSLQAVLDKATRNNDAPAAPVRTPTMETPASEPAPRKGRGGSKPKADDDTAKFYRPVRDGRRFVGAHFPPEVARQLRLIAAEDDTTIQALLEEAVDLLFVKKGRSKISALMNS